MYKRQPHIILQPLAQNAQFTPDSFKYICQVVNDPQCIAVRKDSPYQSTSEIIAAARKNPGKIDVYKRQPLPFSRPVNGTPVAPPPLQSKFLRVGRGRALLKKTPSPGLVTHLNNYSGKS